VRSGPGAARTILLFHTISARPSKEPGMVGSTFGVYSFALIFVSARTNKRHHHQRYMSGYRRMHVNMYLFTYGFLKMDVLSVTCQKSACQRTAPFYDEERRGCLPPSSSLRCGILRRRAGSHQAWSPIECGDASAHHALRRRIANHLQHICLILPNTQRSEKVTGGRGRGRALSSALP
jgi:hypothetical protein